MTIFSALSHRILGRSRTRAVLRPLPARPERMVVIDPAKIFSPDPALIELATSFKEGDEANIRRPKLGDRIFYREIPYSKYQGVLQFHPGRIGGYITSSRLSKNLSVAARNLLDCAVELPNGGLAFYYPKTSTARLQVNEPIYSGIAQGAILAAYTRLIRDRVPQDGAHSWHEIAERVALSMMLPFEEGGVCVDGNVILEAPNFRACPEIILNGWIDALIRLYDYLQFVPSKTYQEFFDRNIAALCEMLPDFDDEKAQLSLYSNLCPYAFRAHFRASRASTAAPPRVRVEYIPVRSGHAGYVIPALWVPGPELRDCIYENKIGKTSSAAMDMTLSVCSLYDIVITIDADCTHLSFDPGTYNETSTVPRRTLQTRALGPAAAYDGQSTAFVVRAAEDRLMTGCPTNFHKNGENFYHGFHITALYEVAMTTRDPAQRKFIAGYADRWLDYIKSPKHDHLIGRARFTAPDSFVKKISRFRAVPQNRSFDELRAMANAPE